ncbi:hypothetical protein WA577_002177 [Blastocystis sp. JDR]
MNSVTFWIEGQSYPYPCDDTQCINDYIDSLSKYGVDKATNYRFWNGRDYCPRDKPLGTLPTTESNSIVVCLVKQGMCTLNGKSTSFWYYTSFQYGRALESALKALGESRSADLFELQDDTGVHKSTDYVPLNGFPDLHHFEIVCKADQPIPKEESKNQPVPKEESKNQPIPKEESKNQPVPKEESKNQPVPKEESKNQQNPDPSTIPVSIQFKETKKSFSFPVNTVIKTVVDKASKAFNVNADDCRLQHDGKNLTNKQSLSKLPGEKELELTLVIPTIQIKLRHEGFEDPVPYTTTVSSTVGSAISHMMVVMECSAND